MDGLFTKAGLIVFILIVMVANAQALAPLCTGEVDCRAYDGDMFTCQDRLFPTCEFIGGECTYKDNYQCSNLGITSAVDCDGLNGIQGCVWIDEPCLRDSDCVTAGTTCKYESTSPYCRGTYNAPVWRDGSPFSWMKSKLYNYDDPIEDPPLCTDLCSAKGKFAATAEDYYGSGTVLWAKYECDTLLGLPCVTGLALHWKRVDFETPAFAPKPCSPTFASDMTICENAGGFSNNCEWNQIYGSCIAGPECPVLIDEDDDCSSSPSCCEPGTTCTEDYFNSHKLCCPPGEYPSDIYGDWKCLQECGPSSWLYTHEKDNCENSPPHVDCCGVDEYGVEMWCGGEDGKVPRICCPNGRKMIINQEGVASCREPQPCYTIPCDKLVLDAFLPFINDDYCLKKAEMIACCLGTYGGVTRYDYKSVTFNRKP